MVATAKRKKRRGKSKIDDTLTPEDTDELVEMARRAMDRRDRRLMLSADRSDCHVIRKPLDE